MPFKSDTVTYTREMFSCTSGQVGETVDAGCILSRSSIFPIPLVAHIHNICLHALSRSVLNNRPICLFSLNAYYWRILRFQTIANNTFTVRAYLILRITYKNYRNLFLTHPGPRASRAAAHSPPPPFGGRPEHNDHLSQPEENKMF